MADDRVPTRPLRPGGGAVVQAAEEPARGDRIGAWIIGERLGGGGFGDVYRVRHHATQHEAALKRLHAHFTASPEILARFDREIARSRARSPGRRQ